MMTAPTDYQSLQRRGAFHGYIDPWSEQGRYFHQIHAGMIGELLARLGDSLFERGHIIGRETSLQIAQGRQPNLFVQSNKQDACLIEDYRQRRTHLLRRGINIVELDPTRLVKRLTDDPILAQFAYTYTIYPTGETPRLIGMRYGEALSDFALPLLDEVLPVRVQPIYEIVYWQTFIALQIQRDHGYTEADLPFPSLLNEAQRRAALEAVQAWRATLAELRGQVTPKS